MPTKLSQATRLATLYCANLDSDVFVLRSLRATEQLGRLSTFEIEVDSEKGDVKADDLLGHSVVITVSAPAGGERYFHGIVNHFSHSPRVGRRYFRYRLTAVPWLWLLTRQADCRIFQHKSVPDIIKDVFARCGFSSWVEDGLHGTYEPWEYCVQYRETDFNFVSRLMEQEGIYYYFKHEAEKHTLVLTDSPDAHLPFPHYDKVIVRARSGTAGQDDELLREWQNEHRHHTGAFAQTDYDFTRPTVDLATRNDQNGAFGYPAAEVYDYPGEYLGYKEGEDLAKVRMEEVRTERVIHHSRGNVVGVVVGHKFSLTGPPGFKNAGDYLVIGSVIHFRNAVYQTGGDEEEAGEAYEVACTLIPAAEPFRPARLTPKPIIQGVQTAVVTGPKGEEIHTDKYGRIKVQFHWDRVGQLDENTTCFIRVGQVWAGKRWGATFIPRIGHEVIVSFLEGDPDQPIVVGSVYNGEQMPPYLGDGPDPKHKDDPKVSGIKSLSTKGGGGFNELRFDDNKGKEEIFLHAEKNLDTRVKASSMETIGGSRFLSVGGEKDGVKSGDQFEIVFKDKHLKVHKDQVEFIGGNQKLFVGGIDGGAGDQDIHVKGIRKVMVDKDDHLTIEGKRTQDITGATSLIVGGNQQEKVEGNHALDVTKEIHLKGGTKVIIEAGTQLTIKAGSGFIDIKADGTVTISGSKVLINSGGSAGSGSGSSPGVVPRPDTANPTLPTVADDSKPGFLSTLGAAPTPPKPTPPVPPDKPTPKTSPLKTGLGDDVDRAIEKCPKFARKIEDLQAKGWKIEYGPAGKGSSAHRESKSDPQSKTIVIDENEKGNTAALVETLSHETGHAAYTPDPYVPHNGLTKDQYAAKNANRGLKDEGEATMSNIEMKNCLKENGGIDIGIAGTQGPKYQAIYDKYPDPKDRDKARQEIADVYADNEHVSVPPKSKYRDYYEKNYREFYDNLPPDQKTP